MVVPESTLNDTAAERLDIDRDLHYQHLKMLNEAGDLTKKINEIFTKPDYETIDDPDAALYGGGFFSDNDKRKMELIRNAEPEHLATMSVPFDDPRLPEMLFRYRARNWSESLSNEEKMQWQQYRQQRLTDEGNEKILTLPRYFKAISASQTSELSPEQTKVLNELKAYGQQIEQQIKPNNV